jgi:hypothetical protein
LGCEKAQTRGASWFGATRLPIKGTKASHKNKRKMGHDENHKQ